jgi:hypothetical protein
MPSFSAVVGTMQLHLPFFCSFFRQKPLPSAEREKEMEVALMAVLADRRCGLAISKDSIRITCLHGSTSLKRQCAAMQHNTHLCIPHFLLWRELTSANLTPNLTRNFVTWWRTYSAAILRGNLLQENMCMKEIYCPVLHDLGVRGGMVLRDLTFLFRMHAEKNVHTKYSKSFFIEIYIAINKIHFTVLLVCWAVPQI